MPTLSRLMSRLVCLLALGMILMAFAVVAHAAPHLLADPYPASAVQPTAATLTVNGGAPIACQLETVAAGVRPKCDLASLTADGVYTLVLTVSNASGIVNGTNTATNTIGGSASSTPFSYTLIRAAVSAPSGSRVQP